jgi:HK97 family phage portal protein
VKTSALHRVQRKPNDYQTRSDFILNLVRSLYADGNAYALGLRNDRFEIDSLHLMDPSRSRGRAIEGEVFYSLAGNAVIESRLEALGLDDELVAVPARDVLHVRLHTKPDDPLRGLTPLEAAYPAVAATNAAMAQSLRFYANQARPSGVLQTDLAMLKPQAEELRQRWEEQATGLAAGKTPILTHGLKWAAVTVSPKDSQWAEALKLSDAQIAQVFRVPLAIVGSEAQPMGSTETLMNLWIASGLGFALNQVELAFDAAFKLDETNNEYSELDSAVLLRSAFKDRIEGLVRGVQGGVFAVNEARATESLPAKKGGDEPRVQQQLLPISAVLEPPAPPAPTMNRTRTTTPPRPPAPTRK